ncbi:glycosyltransferase [Thermovibrio sp.]
MKPSYGESFLKTFLYSLLYITFLVTFLLYLPREVFNPESIRYLVIVGVIALWRYSWFTFNAIRALIYKRIYFPKLRAIASSQKGEELVEHVYIIVTTFRIPEEISIDVYRGAVGEVINCVRRGIKATLIASVVEKAEENLVKEIWKVMNPPEGARLIITRFAGTGKRDGLAVAFRVLLDEPLTLKRSVVALVDGDTILTPNSLIKCAELFSLDRNLGAVTTNEDCILEAKNFTYKLYKVWYNLRFAQRDTYMSSTSLSKKVMTLTGRMSVYRGELFLDPEFADTVQYDAVEHWRIGKIPFLTGDDKSTWFYVLKNGWNMLYVPDVMVYTKESPPADSFFKGATMLMVRWFGNSLRATLRAKKISPRITGWFVWYMIRDQRITMWTGLYGLVASIMGELKWGGGIFVIYVWWILFTRFLMVLYYGIQRGYYYVSWVPLLYFNQIWGSVVKIYINNHLYKQKWTRQKTVLSKSESWLSAKLIVWSSHLSMMNQILIFLILTGYSVGLFDHYDLRRFFEGIGLLK